MLCGFLAPDGTYTECDAYEHLTMAQEIAEKKYGVICKNGVRAEDYLFDQGYVIYYARGAQHRFAVKYEDVRVIVLLTDKQKEFVINNLSNANNDDQKKEIETMLKYDDDFREDSILTRMENKMILG